MLDQILAKVTDPYERQARLYPALLAILPLFATVGLLYAPNRSAITNGVGVAVSCGAVYLVINLCREFGKRAEERLFREWGGKPSTQLLRHRDRTIEEPTKLRYHAFLGGKINEKFPDAQQESENPARADDVYQSGVRWLLNHTRPTDKKFELLFRENIAYGFRRNALGIKPVGIAISLWCIAWILIKAKVFVGLGQPFFDLTRISDTAMICESVSGIMLLVWLFFFTRASVRTAAFTYAEMLLRECDTLAESATAKAAK